MEFNRPANLKLIGNINENFKKFKQEVEVYFLATETHQKPKEVQVARLLNLLGPDGLKLFNTFKIEDATVKTIFECLEEYCVPKKNVIAVKTNLSDKKKSIKPVALDLALKSAFSVILICSNVLIILYSVLMSMTSNEWFLLF
ncbi:hypothetical protein QTP88_018939 [Uroleucon formosanum]